MGRPPKYTPKELKKALFGEDGYFRHKERNATKSRGKAPDMYVSLSDMCNYINLSFRRWSAYRNHESGKYNEVVEMAEQRIIAEWVKNLYYGGGRTTGAIFYLKNISRFSDMTETRHKIEGQLSHQHQKKLESLSDEEVAALNEAFNITGPDDNGKSEEETVIDVD